MLLLINKSLTKDREWEISLRLTVNWSKFTKTSPWVKTKK